MPAQGQKKARKARATSPPRRADGRSAPPSPPRRADGLSALTEQLANRIIKPLGLVLLSRERIRETLDQAAEEGRITRRDSEDLLHTLVALGRQQTDDLLSDLDRVLGRGRQRLDSATKRAASLDRLVRGADRARRTMGVGSPFPIIGYDDLTVGQVQKRLAGLSPPELRKVGDYERRHANRKSVLAAIDKALR